MKRWLGTRTKAELEALTGDRFPLSPIKTIEEVADDAHIRARDMIVPVHYQGARFEVFGNPVKLSDGTLERDAAAPAIGQHNRQVFCEWLGMEAQRFGDLQDRNVI